VWPTHRLDQSHIYVSVHREYPSWAARVCETEQEGGAFERSGSHIELGRVGAGFDTVEDEDAGVLLFKYRRPDRRGLDSGIGLPPAMYVSGPLVKEEPAGVYLVQSLVVHKSLGGMQHDLSSLNAVTDFTRVQLESARWYMQTAGRQCTLTALPLLGRV
jgi:hypothetical protein